MTTERLEVLTTFKNQGGFQMEIFRAIAINADYNTEWVVEVKRAGLDESEMTYR